MGYFSGSPRADLNLERADRCGVVTARACDDGYPIAVARSVLTSLESSGLTFAEFITDLTRDRV